VESILLPKRDSEKTDAKTDAKADSTIPEKEKTGKVSPLSAQFSIECANLKEMILRHFLQVLTKGDKENRLTYFLLGPGTGVLSNMLNAPSNSHVSPDDLNLFVVSSVEELNKVKFFEYPKIAIDIVVESLLNVAVKCCKREDIEEPPSPKIPRPSSKYCGASSLCITCSKLFDRAVLLPDEITHIFSDTTPNAPKNSIAAAYCRSFKQLEDLPNYYELPPEITEGFRRRKQWLKDNCTIAPSELFVKSDPIPMIIKYLFWRRSPILSIRALTTIGNACTSSLSLSENSNLFSQILAILPEGHSLSGKEKDSSKQSKGILSNSGSCVFASSLLATILSKNAVSALREEDKTKFSNVVAVLFAGSLQERLSALMLLHAFAEHCPANEKKPELLSEGLFSMINPKASPENPQANALVSHWRMRAIAAFSSHSAVKNSLLKNHAELLRKTIFELDTSDEEVNGALSVGIHELLRNLLESGHSLFEDTYKIALYNLFWNKPSEKTRYLTLSQLVAQYPLFLQNPPAMVKALSSVCPSGFNKANGYFSLPITIFKEHITDFLQEKMSEDSAISTISSTESFTAINSVLAIWVDMACNTKNPSICAHLLSSLHHSCAIHRAVLNCLAKILLEGKAEPFFRSLLRNKSLSDAMFMDFMELLLTSKENISGLFFKCLISEVNGICHASTESGEQTKQTPLSSVKPLLSHSLSRVLIFLKDQRVSGIFSSENNSEVVAFGSALVGMLKAADDHSSDVDCKMVTCIYSLLSILISPPARLTKPKETNFGLDAWLSSDKVYVLSSNEECPTCYIPIENNTKAIAYQPSQVKRSSTLLLGTAYRCCAANYSLLSKHHHLTLNQLLCPTKHELQLSPDELWPGSPSTCDKCKKRKGKNDCYLFGHCGSCNYDICSDCLASAAIEKISPAAAEQIEQEHRQVTILFTR